MTLDPKKIYEDFKRKDIDRLAAIDSLIYIMGNNDSIEIRVEIIEILSKIGDKSNKTFSILENLLLSDSNQEIKELAATGLKALFQEKALDPLKWVLDHEKSWQILMRIVLLIKEINSNDAKTALIDKIKNFAKYKFNESLINILKNNEIQSFNTDALVEIINNYIIINFFEDIRNSVKYHLEDGNVVELDLSFILDYTYGWKVLKNLTEFLRVLKHLKRLELQSNKLGKVPESIFSLNYLKHLDLSHNNINQLPNDFHGLKSLEFLNLRYNNLTKIPDSISSLRSLKSLDLKHNKLNSLPTSIGKLTSLNYLNLHGNQLKMLPSTIENLILLEELNLGLNNLISVPSWIRKLSSLKKLGLGRNKKLSKFKEWFELLPSIMELNLYDNNIKELPESIGLLSSLEVLVMPNNHLTKLPESFKKLSSLRLLDLSWNDITDIPEWIGSLSSLEEL
ncbi:hypothetical protein LCGC14_1975840, partial [marine sediment metagenome]